MKKIVKAKGGYIITDNYGREEVVVTLEEVFEKLLQHFEGRSKWFGGDSFGCVDIIRKPDSKHKEVEPV